MGLTTSEPSSVGISSKYPGGKKALPDGVEEYVWNRFSILSVTPDTSKHEVGLSALYCIISVPESQGVLGDIS